MNDEEIYSSGEVFKSKNREEWASKLVSDKGTYTNPDLTPEQIELDHKIREKFPIIEIEGIYGDSNRGCRAFVEEIIYPDEGGTFIKLFGCSVHYQGTVDRDITDRVATIKRVILEDMYLITKSPFKYVVPFLVPFWKTALKRLIKRLERIYEADLIKWELPTNHFSRAGRELIRVGLKIGAPKNLVYCVAMLMEGDHAYFHRFRDALSAGDKDLMKTLDVLIEREQCGIIDKFKLVRRILKTALLIPTIKRTLNNFMREINIDEMKLDEADMYFNLNRRLYNFGGRTFEDRYKEFEEMNKKLGNIIFP